jgi:hypothetical protein
VLLLLSSTQIDPNWSPNSIRQSATAHGWPYKQYPISINSGFGVLKAIHFIPPHFRWVVEAAINSYTCSHHLKYHFFQRYLLCSSYFKSKTHLVVSFIFPKSPFSLSLSLSLSLFGSFCTNKLELFRRGFFAKTEQSHFSVLSPLFLPLFLCQERWQRIQEVTETMMLLCLLKNARPITTMPPLPPKPTKEEASVSLFLSCRRCIY